MLELEVFVAMFQFQLSLLFFYEKRFAYRCGRSMSTQDCILINVFISKDTPRYYEKCSDKERIQTALVM